MGELTSWTQLRSSVKTTSSWNIYGTDPEHGHANQIQGTLNPALEPQKRTEGS